MANPIYFEQDTVFPQGGSFATVEGQPAGEPLFFSQAEREVSQATTEEQSLEKFFEEKREFPRIPFRGRAMAVIFPAADDLGSKTIEDSEVVTCDLSREGVSILHRTKLVPGQQMMLMLNESMQLAEVRWCCRVWDGLYVAGCRLEESRPCDIDQQIAAIDAVISNEEMWMDAMEEG
jgi:hypothetical protein